MERRDAVLALEDDLIHCARMAKRAGCLMKDLLDEFFIYGDSPKYSAPVQLPREDYCSAAIKAEIVGETLRDLFAQLDRILDD